MLGLLAAAEGWVKPVIDWHAFAPEIVLAAGVCVVLLLDVVLLERAKALVAAVSGLFLLGATIPLITLAISDNPNRSMFDGAFQLDRSTLLIKALFLISGYVVVLLSTNYVAEGDYWESEYYTLMLSSLLGMLIMASARDLITIFIALELLSIPAYMMAAWRKRDIRSTEAGLKYFLMGVFASAVLLYGMSLLYGVTGSTMLTEIGGRLATGAAGSAWPAATLGVIFVVVGFGFKVSAVPFHTWAPDTYEGAPTPVTAFLSVASKAGGFVGMLNVVFFCFVLSPAGTHSVSRVYVPLFFLLSALTVTVGNLTALRQSNIVRLLAYSGISNAGFMLAPFVVAGASPAAANEARATIIVYLVVYAAMTLGAFAVVIAVARKTRSAEIDSFNGLFHYAPGLAVAMSAFLASLIGIPPFGGWYPKLNVFRSLLEAHTGWSIGLAVILAVNVAIAAAYYLRIAKSMWFEDAPHGDTSPIRVPASLRSALVIAVVATVVSGVLPDLLHKAAAATFALGQ